MSKIQFSKGVPKLTIADYKKVLQIMPVNKAIMIEGIHGIGKSEITSQILKEMGYYVVVVYLAQKVDMGDITGLPYHKTIVDENQETITITDFAVVDWFYELSKPGRKVAVVMEEINRANELIHNGLMEFLLSNKLNGKQIQGELRKVACINPDDASGKYHVNSMDMAQLDRLARGCLCPTAEETISYFYTAKHSGVEFDGQDIGFAPEVIQFLSKNSSLLDPNFDSQDAIQPSRRSWEDISKLIWKTKFANMPKQEMLDTISLVAPMIVGSAATVMLVQFLQNASSGLNALDLLTKQYTEEISEAVKTMDKKNHAMFISQMTIKLKELLVTKNVKIIVNVIKYLKDAGDEVSGLFIEQVQDAVLKNEMWALYLIEDSTIYDLYDQRITALSKRN